jgi:hypothetical protein
MAGSEGDDENDRFGVVGRDEAAKEQARKVECLAILSGI